MGQRSEVLVAKRALFGLAALFIPHLALAAPAGNVVSIQGSGDVRAAGKEAWTPARANQDLFFGDLLRTGSLSQIALLLLPDRMQIRLTQNSQLQIKTPSETKEATEALIRLNAGRAWSSARGAPARSREAPPALLMETPSAALAIRGTEWEVEVGADGRAQLTVLSGEVEMYNEQGRIVVASGEAALAEIGRAPVKIQIANPRERVQWVVRWRLEPQRYFAPGAAPDALAQRAASLIGEGKLADAAALLGPAAARGDAPLPVLLMTADLRVIEGRRAEALALMRRAQAIDGGSIARAQLARLLLLEDQQDAAVAALAPALAPRPGAVEAWIAQGELERFRGDAAAARAAYESARAHAPRDHRSWGGLGAIAAEREEVALARELLAEAIKLGPHEAGHHGELGTLEAFAGRFRESAAAFELALALQPDDYVALTGRGVLKIKQGRAAEALEDFLRAGVIEPRYARAQLFAGIAHYQLGNSARALEALRRAGELDTRDPLPPLYASMIHTDLFEAGEALAQAREAQARMPYLKSLNQVANNQKGAANLGNALAFRGLRDWALAYAQDGYTPYWAGSHLFLADQYEGRYARNSELFQGFLADPTVFGASNRFQSLIHRPGHYQTGTLVVGRDRQVLEYVPRVTFNGYMNQSSPFAYFLDADVKKSRERSGQPFQYDDRTTSVTAAVGWMPRHELRLFAYYSRDSTHVSYADPVIPQLSLRAPFTDFSAGLTWMPGPTDQVQVRFGTSRVEGSQDQLSSSMTRRIRFVDKEVSRDAQLGFRKRIGDRWELGGGLEYAESPEQSGLSVRATATGALLFEDLSGIAERTWLGYVTAKRLRQQGEYLQFDLVAIDYSKHTTHDTNVPPVVTFAARDDRQHRLAPRLGYTRLLAPGLRLRAAYQDFVRPSSPVTLGPVATAGIPLDETLLRFGGRSKRLVAKLEQEWSPRLFGEVSLDHRSARNSERFDLTLTEAFANLVRLRQRSVADAAAFYAGTTNTEYSTLLYNTRAEVTQLRGALNAALTNTWSGTASYTATHSRISLLQEDTFYLPRHQLNLGLTWMSPSRWRLTFEPVWRSRSHTFADLGVPRDSYWSAAASAYWESRDKRYSVAAFAKDLASPYDSAFYGAAASLRF